MIILCTWTLRVNSKPSKPEIQRSSRESKPLQHPDVRMSLSPPKGPEVVPFGGSYIES